MRLPLLTTIGLISSLTLVLHLATALHAPAATRSRGTKAPTTRGAPEAQPQARAILLKELKSGRLLYAAGTTHRLAPASLTKIMSALVILEQGHLQEIVTISQEAAAAPRTRLDLWPGQRFYLVDLLQAMLITSANDACRAAAQHVGGSEQQFVALMNQKATTLQLQDTHFTNACGFDGPQHYSTAEDLARLSEVALQDPRFTHIVKQEKSTMKEIGKGRVYELHSTNHLLGESPGVEGIKTGFTRHAGPCLIVKVSQNDTELLLVLLHAKQRWATALQLLQHGFETLAR